MKYFCMVICSLSAMAQLNTVFEGLINEVLINRISLSPGEHANHFRGQAERANASLSPALNSLIAANVSSFPNSSTAVGISYDFSSGAPQKVIDSLGPIFGENGNTLGKKKLFLSLTASHLSLDRFRGIRTEDIRFTFTHQDVNDDGVLGDNPNESDTIDLFMDLNVDAELYVFTAAYGLTDNLDFSIAVPYINLEVGGVATARINSFTFGYLGLANHNFNSDPYHPQLETTIPYGDTASGIGDISLRFKFQFLREKPFDMALLLDVRTPSGKEENFLGTGSTSFKITEVISRKSGNFSPHLNLSYEKRNAELDSDEIEIGLGFDHKTTDSLTFACEFLGEFDVSDSEKIEIASGSVTIRDIVDEGFLEREVDLSNIPDRENDDAFSGAVGFRYGPSDKFNILGNILVPLNDGGLRSQVAGTLGLSVYF